jgi:hypothetical protein
MHCRKRTKKTAPKPGRKRSKVDPTPSGGDTPRTRLALAREAAAKAAREAEEAAAKAAAAAEAAVAAEIQVIAPLQIEQPPPPSPTARRYAIVANKCLAKTYCCHYDNMSSIFLVRSLCWDLQVGNEVDETATTSHEPPTKKMTPRRKALAGRKKSPAKNGKK